MITNREQSVGQPVGEINVNEFVPARQVELWRAPELVALEHEPLNPKAITSGGLYDTHCRLPSNLFAYAYLNLEAPIRLRFERSTARHSPNPGQEVQLALCARLPRVQHPGGPECSQRKDRELGPNHVPECVSLVVSRSSFNLTTTCNLRNMLVDSWSLPV